MEKVDFDFFAVIEVFDDSVSKFGESARTDITADIFIVFVHEEEDVGAFKILEERDIDVGEILSVIAFGRNSARVVNDFIATAFKIASPVSGTFLEFGTSCDDEFLHNLYSWPEVWAISF